MYLLHCDEQQINEQWSKWWSESGYLKSFPFETGNNSILLTPLAATQTAPLKPTNGDEPPTFSSLQLSIPRKTQIIAVGIMLFVLGLSEAFTLALLHIIFFWNIPWVGQIIAFLLWGIVALSPGLVLLFWAGLMVYIEVQFKREVERSGI